VSFLRVSDGMETVMVRDDWEESEWDAEVDAEDDGAETCVTTCQHCGRAMYEDGLQCPACGLYATREGRTVAARPLWQTLGAVAAILAVLTWFLCW
jgi:ribosomal protein L37E